MVEFLAIIAPTTGTSWRAVAIIGKAVTVELETLRFATITRLLVSLHLIVSVLILTHGGCEFFNRVRSRVWDLRI